VHKSGRELKATQEDLNDLRGIANYLKLLLRIGLKSSLESSALDFFLLNIPGSTMKKQRPPTQFIAAIPELSVTTADSCARCSKLVNTACYMKLGRLYHSNCLECQLCKNVGVYGFEPTKEDSRGVDICHSCSNPHSNAVFIPVRKQYIYLLWVGISRLGTTLKVDWSEIFAEK
jgi:hypothetical protein